MLHLLLRASPGDWLFADDAGARALWVALGRSFVGLGALCLLPDRLHLLTPHPDAPERLAAALRGLGLRPVGPPAARPGHREEAAMLHALPARLGLVADPLAWAWSTHRDRLDLAAPALVPPDPEPRPLHRRVRALGGGGELPGGPGGPVGMEEVVAALSAASRRLPAAFDRPGPDRVRLVRTAAALGVAWRRPPADLEARAARVGPHAEDPTVAAALRVLGDPRFPALSPDDRRGSARWAAYAARMRRAEAIVVAAARTTGRPVDPFRAVST